MMKKNIQVQDKLRYAKKDIRNYRNLSLIFLAVTGVFVLLLFLCNIDIINSFEIEAFMLAGVFCAMVGCVGTFLMYLDGKIYLCDLKKKGFTIPETKEECGRSLSMIPYEEKERKEGKLHIRTFILAVITGLITVVAAVYTFTETKRPYPLFITIMVILTVIMFLQSFNRLYKNDIDIDIVDSRRIRKRIIPATVTVTIWMMVLGYFALIISGLPTFNYLYYDQIIRYYKNEDAEGYRYYMDSLPSYAGKIEFISWGKACGVSFYVPQENVKDIRAYFEGIDEPCVIHTIEEGQDEFAGLCEQVKDLVTNFDSKDYQNCVVYEFTELHVMENGNTFSWYAIIDTKSGEVGYGNFPTDM